MKFIFFYSPLFEYYRKHIYNTLGPYFHVESYPIEELNTNGGHPFLTGQPIKIDLILRAIQETWETISYLQMPLFL